ncbi:twin-arginine translocation signal domain-containing protein [Hymenobacter lutimineralis]|uniref:Twin-arginine translocation signal domain-containing protein n=1 Tax=Hymenobacter lutimineralis TaxID=2606448 RepID=A0A5D6UYX2_9BACT|nr:MULTISPECIES: metallophosphatase [Hymenobacter]QIX60745.1 twin-arginine translocation signal domain-containing protein [Hymenobacter sp. BT18]TYZ08616.1 twin-arginine translocation signal domain-containing protein [Hymenobacter lutimineralis]
MDRREFLKHSTLGAASLGLLGLSLPAAAADAAKLVILHTNDMHSRIEPFPDNAAQWAGMGGMARRAALIEQVRRQEPHVLLLDSGDIWQGTPYFNFFGGELEYKLMSQMRYDASTLGNHDFDNGLEGLQKQLPNAAFPFLSANYDFSETLLAGRFQPYKVFEKAGHRIGVFGVGIKLAGLVADRNYGATKYLDPIATARDMVAKLRGAEKCDMVICLSHLGYKYEDEKIDDFKLAAGAPGIDLILGGHTHTFLEKPDVVKGPNGHQTLINQVGWSGINLGRIDYVFERGTRRPGVAQAAVLPVHTA